MRALSSCESHKARRTITSLAIGACFALGVAATGLSGCSSEAGTVPPDAYGGDSSLGGASTASGGKTSAGGAASGGSANGGASTASGGKSSASGGKSSGGATQTGGSSAGGKAAGGRTGGGGSASGGANRGGATGGGGAPASGGQTGASGAPPTGKKFVGNITTGSNHGIDVGGRSFAKYWDQITPENAGKWGSVQSSASAAFNWATLDAIYDYTQKNNIIFKQHTFVWGNQQPSGSINETSVKNWMSAFCKRYPNTKLIDVVNEPPPHTTPSYANSIGGGTNGTWQWITNAFKWAREACPNAILILNDYNNIEYTNESNHFIDIVKKVKAAGGPIDAVGCQAHALDDAAVTFDTGKRMMANLNTQTGLPLYITEFDISSTDDTAQLNKYKDYIPFFMDTSYIHGVTIWGWIYGQTWSQSPNSGLIRNGTPRSAMTWLMQQLGRPAP
ncbi:MAG: endo-1,4-beta-xylanase [Myxococcota bacterium]